MAEILLIDAQYVKKYTPVNGSVDDNFIYAAMYIAQDKDVQPYLGDSLMAKLKADVAGSGTTGDYTTLLEDYVQRAVCWWTMVNLLPNLAYKVDNGTIVQRTSEDATPVPDNIMKDLKTRAEGNARYYAQRMVDYLCANSQLFPEYSNNQWPQRSPRVDVYGQFNYAFTSGNTAMNVRNYWKRPIDYMPFPFDTI